MKRLNSISLRLVVLGATAVGFMGAKPFVAFMTELSGFDVAASLITTGATTSARATLTALPKYPIPVVAFKSSKTNVVTVPSSKTVNSDGTATVPVTAVGPGCATVSATYGSQTRSDEILVQPPVATTSFGFTTAGNVVPWPASIDATLTKTVSLNSTSPTSTTTTKSGGTFTIDAAVWTITSSDPTVVSVPSTVPQTLQTTHFKITGKKDGCVLITATLGSQSITRVIRSVYIGG